ncbi:MAG: hypothetical protein PHW04_17375, partial [Candidatus Wallbacteria bacterium]|nr:hypothetical protein [Candidatus Wallbacteria bacterium]
MNYDSGLSRQFENFFPEYIYWELGGERWRADLFDFTLDSSDLCVSGLKLLVHDNSYTGEAYVGYRNQQLNALGPEINTCGLIFHS